MSTLDDAYRAEIVGMLTTEAEGATNGNGKEAALLLVDAALTVLCSRVPKNHGRLAMATEMAGYLVKQVNSITGDQRS